nr:hypothetical protein BaRGS_014691 [Batillaria attramentaria]
MLAFDGPTTQYRQKMNFYLFSTEVYKIGFTGGTWNFLAAGHGKGIPDGIGAAVKRAADNRVLHGADIVNSETLVMFAYGNDNHPAEMRVRIIHELALNEEYYLNKDNLSRGLATCDPQKVINSFYMY